MQMVIIRNCKFEVKYIRSELNPMVTVTYGQIQSIEILSLLRLYEVLLKVPGSVGTY
jgi:hypothetical protein